MTGEGGVGDCAWNKNRGEAYTEYYYVPVSPLSLPIFFNFTFTFRGGGVEIVPTSSLPSPSFILHNRVQQLQVLGRLGFYHASVNNTSVEGKSASWLGPHS